MAQSMRQRQLCLELSRLTAPKTAATVFIDGKPWWTAFTHAAAFACMRMKQSRGIKANYKHGVYHA